MDPFAVCYLQAESIKRLTVSSPTFLNFFARYHLFLPHECMGVLMGKPQEKEQKEKDKEKEERSYFGDELILKAITNWFGAVDICYRQNRIHTLAVPILILHGNPGCGKTFLLQRLSTQFHMALQHVSLSNGIDNLKLMTSHGNLLSRKSILYLQDVALLPKEWLKTLHVLYQKGQLKSPLIIELDTNEYYTSRYLKDESKSKAHKRTYPVSLYRFWRHESFVQHVHLRTKTKHVLAFLNWMCGKPAESKMFEHIAKCANGDFRRARQLLEEKSIYLETAIPLFRTLFDVGVWCLQDLARQQQTNSFEISKWLSIFGANEPDAVQLNCFFQSLIHSFHMSQNEGEKQKEEESLISWDARKKRSQLLKTEETIVRLAKRKGIVDKDEQRLEEWMIESLDHFYLHTIQLCGLDRFGCAGSKEKKKDESDRVVMKTKQRRETTAKQNADLYVLEQLTELNSELDACNGSGSYEANHEAANEASKVRVVAMGRKIRGPQTTTTTQHPYKSIMGWFKRHA